MWSKNGGPTLMARPVRTADTTGNTVPRNTENATARNSTLFRRNALSRESVASSSFRLRRSSHRQAARPKATSSASARNPRKNAPSDDWVNEWMLLKTPLRVRNVPKIDSPNARITSTTFHFVSISRRSWICTECKKCRRHQPGHQRGVLDRVPRPVPAPPQHDVRPLRPEHQPHAEAVPRPQHPPPREQHAAVPRRARGEGRERRSRTARSAPRTRGRASAGGSPSRG